MHETADSAAPRETCIFDLNYSNPFKYVPHAEPRSRGEIHSECFEFARRDGQLFILNALRCR
jgi:hypothetical protein